MPNHPLNHDPYARPSSEQEQGTRHPSRFEPKQQTISNTQIQQRMRANVFRAANQAIVTATPTAVSFDTKLFDTSGIWNGTTRLTIPSTGKVSGTWQVAGQVDWTADAAGSIRQVQIRKNGVTALKTFAQAPSVAQIQSVSVLVNDPNPGDFYELVVTQDAGHSVNILGGQDLITFEAIHLW